MKKILKTYLIIITFLYSCDYYKHEELLLKNNSEQNVIYIYSFDQELKLEDINYNKDTLKIGDSIRSLSKNSWRNNIKELSKDNTLRIYFINSQYLKKYDWVSILKQKKYILKKYTIKELDSLKWIIIYNGK